MESTLALLWFLGTNKQVFKNLRKLFFFHFLYSMTRDKYSFCVHEIEFVVNPINVAKVLLENQMSFVSQRRHVSASASLIVFYRKTF